MSVSPHFSDISLLMMEVSEDFLENIGLDNIAYRHAQMFHAVDQLPYNKFNTELDRQIFFQHYTFLYEKD